MNFPGKGTLGESGDGGDVTTNKQSSYLNVIEM